MTSNQINAALQREQERHNKEAELLALRQQQEQEHQNRVQNALKISGLINEGAANINNSIKGSYANAIQAQQAQVQSYSALKNAEYQSKMADVEKGRLSELERHQKQEEELTLRNIKHFEYQDWLTAKQNDFMRNQKLFENNQTLLENEQRAVEQQMNRYRNELERKRIDVMALEAYMTQIKTQYDIDLTKARTGAEKAMAYSTYVNSAANLIKSITNILAATSF